MTFQSVASRMLCMIPGGGGLRCMDAGDRSDDRYLEFKDAGPNRVAACCGMADARNR